MLLAVDVGNTQTHIGMFRGEELVEHWRFATVRESTSDELATVIVALLDLRGLGLEDVDAAMVSSVVPQLVHEYERVSERYLGGMLQVVGPGLSSGMPIRIEHPHEVGADRLVNAVAAYDRIGGAASWSTSARRSPTTSSRPRASTWAAVISPGVEISMEALSERAAALPRSSSSRPRS